MLKRIAFFNVVGTITSMEQSVIYVLRELRPDGEMHESFGLTEALQRMVSESKGLLENTIVILPGDEVEFDRLHSIVGKTKRRGGRMARKKNGTMMGESKACPLGKEFVFRTPMGREIGKAKSVSDLVALIRSAPLESVLYHANGRHFGPWLEMIGMRSIASYVNAVKGNDDGVRRTLIQALS